MLRRLIATTTVGVALVASSPALAAGDHHAVPNHKIGHGSSTNWSGYAVTGHGPYTSVSSSWTVPAVDCLEAPTGYSSFWVGLDGDTTSTVEQTGTEADCSSGSPVYYGWYEMYPKFPVNYSDRVSSGDKLSASVTASGTGSFALTLTDATQGWSQRVVKSLKSAKLGSAEVVAEAPASSGGVVPLADFGTVGFGAATANGASLSSLAGLDPITMVTSSGAVKAKPSSIGSDGSFTDTWFHS